MKRRSVCWLVWDLYVTAAFHDWPDWPVHHRSPLTVCHRWGCSCSAVIPGPGINPESRICCGKLRSLAVGILLEKLSPAEEKCMTPLRRLQPSAGATAAREISVQGLDNTLLLKEGSTNSAGRFCFFFFCSLPALPRAWFWLALIKRQNICLVNMRFQFSLKVLLPSSGPDRLRSAVSLHTRDKHSCQGNIVPLIPSSHCN